MFCIKCGTDLPANAEFCPICGTPAPVIPAADPVSMFKKPGALKPAPDLAPKPAAPEMPAAPETPAAPSAPAVPETPAVPAAPAMPAVPETPAVPAAPAMPAVPAAPAMPAAKPKKLPTFAWVLIGIGAFVLFGFLSVFAANLLTGDRQSMPLSPNSTVSSVIDQYMTAVKSGKVRDLKKCFPAALYDVYLETNGKTEADLKTHLKDEKTYLRESFGSDKITSYSENLVRTVHDEKSLQKLWDAYFGDAEGEITEAYVYLIDVYTRGGSGNAGGLTVTVYNYNGAWYLMP